MEEKLLEQQYIDSSDFDIEMRFLLEGLMALTMVRLMALNCLKLKWNGLAILEVTWLLREKMKRHDLENSKLNPAWINGIAPMFVPKNQRISYRNPKTPKHVKKTNAKKKRICSKG